MRDCFFFSFELRYVDTLVYRKESTITVTFTVTVEPSPLHCAPLALPPNPRSTDQSTAKRQPKALLELEKCPTSQLEIPPTSHFASPTRSGLPIRRQRIDRSSPSS